MSGCKSLVLRYFAMVKSELALPTSKGARASEGLVEDMEVPESPVSLDQHSKRELENSSIELEITDDDQQQQKNLTRRQRMSKYWTVVATGAGLFSDGYINSSIGLVVTMLKRKYGKKEIEKSNAMSLISSMAFLGTVVGMIIFGFMSDHVSRKLSMIISTLILILFSILVAGSWGVGMPADPAGMFACITAYRAIIGLGIGGEYPAGSVACAETSQQITSGRRNRWFIWFTNLMLVSGNIIACFIAWILLYICGVPKNMGTHGLGTAWRLLLGLGAVAPCSLLYLRVKFKENDQFEKYHLKRAGTPYLLTLKYYFPRLFVVSLIWFIYDFCSYSWNIYSSQIIHLVIKDNNMHTQFGWSIVFAVFSVPGSFLGGFVADYLGPRLCLFGGSIAQGIVGFIMSSQFFHLSRNPAPLVVSYGIFMTLSQFAAGNNIGLIASKTSSSAIRGRYYGIAAAVGKIGAFVGTYVFPIIAKKYGGLDSIRGQEVLLYISSAMCTCTGLLALILPPLSQSAVNDEDVKFRRYLAKNGFDTSLMGNGDMRKD